MWANFRYAVQEGVVERDPTQDLKGALKSRKVKHHAAIKDLNKHSASGFLFACRS
jgi:homoserine dehydrogenase